MPVDITIQVKGLLELQQKLRQAPVEMARVMKDAAGLVGDTVLNTEGLRKYPPATRANQPPPPYYIRGQGMVLRGRFRQVKRVAGSGGIYSSKYQTVGFSEIHLNNSERLGTKFYSLGQVTGLGSTITRIGNVASYASHVIGDEDQARAMGRIGWRKLGEVAREKQARIRDVFEAVIQAALKRLGL
jgi:hypothetical protein